MTAEAQKQQLVCFAMQVLLMEAGKSTCEALCSLRGGSQWIVLWSINAMHVSQQQLWCESPANSFERAVCSASDMDDCNVQHQHCCFTCVVRSTIAGLPQKAHQQRYQRYAACLPCCSALLNQSSDALFT